MSVAIGLACGLALALMMDFGVAAAAGPDPLPRKHGNAADESYPGVAVGYDTVRDSAGHRLRLIVTRPQSGARVPAILVVGWLSCDSVEAPAGTRDSSQLVLRAIAALPGFATVRLDKAGVGDSEGDCARTDFETELSGYRAAFRKIKEYPFVDVERVFLFGMSNGGGFAPLVAEGAPVRGYVVDGAWVKTWYEHMLEIERRRLALAGTAPAELNARMKQVEQLYSGFLLDRRAPRQLLEQHPELKAVWDGGTDDLYGRPVEYYQQLQDLDLMAAWSRVAVPVLALHGEFDWIMSRADHELIVDLVNHNAPGTAEFVELPATGHTFEHYPSLPAAFQGMPGPFDPAIAGRVTGWFERHR
jgi:pimeloyl-ACP methyl ester carboxylesterase